MARSISGNDSREALLNAGWMIARKTGLRGLTVRGVARRAKANLGTFVYHFRSRDEFIAELIERWYAPLLARVQIAVEQDDRAVIRLRRAVTGLVNFALESGEFGGQILMDAAVGEPAARRFLDSLLRRHPALVTKLISQAQSDGELAEGDPNHIMMYMMASLGLPILLMHGWKGRGNPKNRIFSALTRYAVDETGIAQRMDWIFKGLRP
jgi:AcrR family transcriptional regulator